MSWEGVEWERVTSFASLRPSDVLKCTACACGGDHIVTLLNFREAAHDVLRGGFEFVPVPSHFPVRRPHEGPWVIADVDVQTGKVYRAIIPPAAEATSTKRTRRLPAPARAYR